MKTLVLLLLTIFVSLVQYSVADEDVGFRFKRDLGIGDSGEDVVVLQEFLVSKEFMLFKGDVKRGEFDTFTRSALKAYQLLKGIKPVTGFFGPLTRRLIQEEVDAKKKKKPGKPMLIRRLMMATSLPRDAGSFL